MTTLVLRLAGPLQSWGASSRFARRETRREPTKSGVLGLLAAAQGLRRTDSIEHLVGLRFGVRVDQPGELVRDFQTARSLDGRRSMPLSYRYYLSDAVFVAGVEGDDQLLHGLNGSLQAPTFAVYLGRRSCPPSLPVSMGVVDGDVEDVLREVPWQASPWYRRRCSVKVALPLVRDAGPSEEGDLVADHPVSFSPERREYGWRRVTYATPVQVDNPDGRRGSEPDFLAALSGA